MEERLNYEKTLDMAEAGDHQQALENIRRRLIAKPDDAEAINDAGAILHCLGYSDEALAHLLKARRLLPESAEVVWNLVETYLAADKPQEAEALLNDMERMNILSADVMNRTANAFLKNNDAGAAVRMLRRSLEFSPEQQMLGPMIEKLEKV